MAGRHSARYAHARFRTGLPLGAAAAILLPFVGAAAQAEVRERILLTRQVGPPGPANPAVVVLVANVARNDADAPACHFTGVLRGEEAGPDFGAGLKQVVFEPLDLAPGESLAIDLPPTEPDGSVMPLHDRVLVASIERQEDGVGPCPLLVQALGYDPASAATAGIYEPPYRLTIFGSLPSGDEAERRRLPLGFVGGSAAQSARLVLLSDHDGPVPDARCTPAGEVTAQVVPRLGGGGSGVPIEQAWPVKWEGPGLESIAVTEIALDELVPGAPGRVDALVSLRYDAVLPAVCRARLSGSLEIYDVATGEVRAAIPLDRVFPDYHHFHN